MLTVGKSVPRLDALSKVTGTAVYARDLSVPGMLHMKLVFAGRPHARIVGLDTTHALASPGVHAVFTVRDVPHNLYGLMIADQPVFCADVVRFVGDRVAAVVAETPEQAAAAAALVVVQYEDLPVLADPDQALRPDAPILHTEHPDNVLRIIRLRRGGIATDDDFSFEQIGRFFQHKAQHIGSIIVLQVLAIERVDGRVVHQGDADATSGGPMVVEDRSGHADELVTIHGDRGLLIRNFDFDHGTYAVC